MQYPQGVVTRNRTRPGVIASTSLSCQVPLTILESCGKATLLSLTRPDAEV